MVSAIVSDNAETDVIDRRAAERYDIEIDGFLLAHGEKYPIHIKDVSIYGLGISSEGAVLRQDLKPHEDVYVEWGPDGETLHAKVVWTYKGRYGFVIKPHLENDHPLIVRGKSLKSVNS